MQMGVLDDLNEESVEGGIDESKVKGEGVLRARARARAEKEKERVVDEALTSLKGAALPLVGVEGGVGDDDIKRVVDEANLDLLHEQVDLGEKEDIRLLLDKMRVEVDMQAEIRSEKQREARKDVEEVVEMTKKGGKLSDLAYEPKQYAGEIGEIYQAPGDLPSMDEGGWVEGDGDGDEKMKGGGEEKTKEERKEEGKEETKGEDKENVVGGGGGKDLAMMMMELESAQAKAHLSLDRADAANRELSESSSQAR